MVRFLELIYILYVCLCVSLSIINFIVRLSGYIIRLIKQNKISLFSTITISTAIKTCLQTASCKRLLLLLFIILIIRCIVNPLHLIKTLIVLLSLTSTSHLPLHFTGLQISFQPFPFFRLQIDIHLQNFSSFIYQSLLHLSA